MLHTTDYIIHLLQLHCTALLTDREFNRFISEYLSNKSRKNRAKLVAATVQLFTSRALEVDAVKQFTSTLDSLLGTLNNVNNKTHKPPTFTVRTHLTHNAVDWLCVGDSVHWDSCLRTGYARECTSNTDRTPSAQDLLDWVQSKTTIEEILTSGCNANYAAVEYEDNQHVVLVTSGNPVYQDGKGYVSRVRLHEGAVRKIVDGKVVNRDCLIWDRFYGHESLLLPTWEEAIEYAKVRDVLLVRLATKHDDKNLKLEATKDWSQTYSDGIHGYNNVVLVTSLSDVKPSLSSKTAHKWLMGKRDKNQSLRAYTKVNPHTLTAITTSSRWVTAAVIKQRARGLTVNSVCLYEHPDNTLVYYTRDTPSLLSTELTDTTLRSVIGHYGYPVDIVRDAYRTRYYFKRPDTYNPFTEISTNPAYQDIPYIDDFNVYSCHVSSIRIGYRRVLTHLSNRETKQMFSILTDSTHDMVSITYRTNYVNRCIEALAKLPLYLVPYPTSIPGTQCCNIGNKRKPKQQLEYLTKALKKRYSKVSEYSISGSTTHNNFMRKTMPYILDLLELFEHDAWE